MVSQRDTQRYLLFDDDMRLRGWTNIATGEVKSPFDHIEVDKLQRYAFRAFICSRRVCLI